MNGFFEDFDRVLFWGAGSGGYAACAYAVAAPGAQVLAYRPQATLAQAWRGGTAAFVADRRRDFTSRYGYAPDMIEGAGAVHVVHDPGQPMDAMHAALFSRENVRHYRVPTGGTRIDQMFDAMGIGSLLMQTAMAGNLNAVTFAQAWRARRTSVAYLRQLLRRLDADGRTGLIRSLCKHGLTTRERADLCPPAGRTGTVGSGIADASGRRSGQAQMGQNPVGPLGSGPLRDQMQIIAALGQLPGQGLIFGQNDSGVTVPVGVGRIDCRPGREQETSSSVIAGFGTGRQGATGPFQPAELIQRGAVKEAPARRIGRAWNDRAMSRARAVKVIGIDPWQGTAAGPARLFRHQPSGFRHRGPAAPGQFAITVTCRRPRRRSGQPGGSPGNRPAAAEETRRSAHPRAGWPTRSGYPRLRPVTGLPPRPPSGSGPSPGNRH